MIEIGDFIRNFVRTDTEKKIENGIIKQMRADWLLPNNTKLEVTLKILNSKDHLNVMRDDSPNFVAFLVLERSVFFI